jgi:hypothetical protein
MILIWKILDDFVQKYEEIVRQEGEDNGEG